MSGRAISTPVAHATPRTLAPRALSRLSDGLFRALTPSAAGPVRGRVLETVRRALQTRPDARGMWQRLPGLGAQPAVHERLRVSLLPTYRHFAASVASPASAMSLEVASFLLELCERRRPRRVLEVGTGFASAVLRRARVSLEWAPEIWSADEDPDRLARTRAFLAAESLPTDRLLSWRELCEQGEDGFDLAVHELVPEPDSALTGILDRVSAGGLLLLDGAQHPVAERSARRLLTEAGAEHWSLRAMTRDCFGRYALLALR